jgi:hypothetical protein
MDSLLPLIMQIIAQVIRMATILIRQKIVQMLLTMFQKPKVEYTGFKQNRALSK